jgi:hypothetical protein
LRTFWLRALMTVALACAVSSSVLAFSSSAVTSTTSDALATPVLMVHGYSSPACPGSDVGNVWSGMYADLWVARWTAPVMPVLFYKCDSDGVDITGYGPTVPSGATTDIIAGPPRVAYTQATPIEQIAHDLAWFVYDRYTSTGTPVDLVGVSMGGLIVRDALYRVAVHDPSFPPSIQVARAVGLSTPNAGLGTLATDASLCNATVQCNEMASDSPFMTDLMANAMNPQGDGGTAWTQIGSTAGCDLVPGTSSLAMPSATRIDYTLPCYTHIGYLADGSLTGDATVNFATPGAATATTYTTELHSLALMRQVLMAPAGQVPTPPAATSTPTPTPTSTTPTPTPTPTSPTPTPTPTSSTPTPTPTPTPSSSPPPTGGSVAPSVQMVSPTSLFAATSNYSLAWTGTSAGSAVADYDLRYRTAGWNFDFTSYRYPASWQGITWTGFAVSASPGFEYCYSVRAHDVAGDVSAWTPDDCRATPLDDRSLSTVTSGWQRITDSSAYGGTLTQTDVAGAELQLTGARVDQLALVVVECPTCGMIRIDLNGQAWQTVNTYSALRQYGVVLVEPAFTSRTATITLTDVDGNDAIIDGIDIAH